VSGLFFFCEGLFLAVAARGALLEARRDGAPRRRWLWLGAVGAYTALIWAYRCVAGSGDFRSFHYLFVCVALAAVLFGRAVDEFVSRFSQTVPWGRTAASFLILAAAHQPVFWAIRSAYLNDVERYERIAAFGGALAAAPPGERVAVRGAPVRLSLLLGLGVLRDDPPYRSKLMTALDGAFAFVEEKDPAAVAIVVENGRNRAVLLPR
jgi:hypothetical protein